jgi:hypothetical protein
MEQVVFYLTMGGVMSILAGVFMFFVVIISCMMIAHY